MNVLDTRMFSFKDKEDENQKMYEADDKMISIIRDNYNIYRASAASASTWALATRLCVRFATSRRWILILSSPW